MNKHVSLIIVLVLIAGSIWYLGSLKSHNTSSGAAVQVSTVSNAKSAQYKKALELVSPSGFVNTEPFKIQDLVGKKVILLDFWTYSCINCQRTLPYLTSWYEKYKDKGLVIVGVHTPEFQFEHDIKNVTAATKKFGITYPVVLDNDYGTWNAYQNQYWPAEYLIDTDGYIVHTHFGEGDYDVTEKAIQDALHISTDMAHPSDVVSVDGNKLGSPETYFGSARNDYLGNGKPHVPGVQNFQLPATTQPNTLYLSGGWNITDQYAQTTGPAQATYTYQAKTVYFVAGSDSPVSVTVKQDGKVIRTIMIQAHTLYTLVQNPDYQQHTLELIVNAPGLQAYTFTFG